MKCIQHRITATDKFFVNYHYATSVSKLTYLLTYLYSESVQW